MAFERSGAGVTHQRKIAVIGLGYVGLPVAVAFARDGRRVIGFDIDASRISDLREGRDRTREVDSADLRQGGLRFTCDPGELAACDFFIVTVPTPIDPARNPDLGAMLSASRTVGAVLKKGDIVVYESTVYPGAVEEDCAPVLEAASGLRSGLDFKLGYSPERINPGDREHRFETITKVVSAQDDDSLDTVAQVYGSVVKAGIHRAPSIRVAEAAKVIENTQRDLNIALINDLAMLFNRLGIDTLEVLEAAGTKWNFLPFRPGLVGGHCISVDPYYLTHKAQQVGHHPDVILAGRRTNDGMGPYVASEVVRLMVRKGINPVHARVLILGLAFKENCPDLRNTRVVDIVRGLDGYGVAVDVHDPWVDADEAMHEYGLRPVERPEHGDYDAVVIAVGHRQFADLGADGIRAFGKPASLVYDVKYVLPRDAVDGRL
jgi:UDP-N-acetyl-D-galactosamine dehydrogenase